MGWWRIRQRCVTCAPNTAVSALVLLLSIAPLVKAWKGKKDPKDGKREGESPLYSRDTCCWVVEELERQLGKLDASVMNIAAR